MIPESEKKEIIEMYKKGMSKSAIARKKGRGRNKVAEIVNAAQEVPSEKVAEVSNKTPDNSLANDPDIVAAKKKLMLAKLKQEKREVEAPLEIEKDLEGFLSKLEQLNESINDAHQAIAYIRQELSLNPLRGINNFKCNCGAKGRTRIHFQCSNCSSDALWGWP